MVLLRKKGMEIKELSELYGISHSSIYYILARQGFPQERAGYRKGKIPFATRMQILEEYKNGALVTDLSNKYNVTVKSIYHHLDRNNLRIKKEHLPPKPEPAVTEPIVVRDVAPTKFNHAKFGTQVLDLPRRQLYVQMSRDEANPQCVCLNPVTAPEKKGILSRIKGWFIK